MKKKVFCFMMASIFTISSLIGCTSKTENSSNTDTASNKDVVVIHYPTMQVGTNTAAPVIEQLVKEFNTTYEGKYKIVVEDVPGDNNYAEKIKILLGSDSLPPVVYGAGYNLLDLALAQDKVIDLTPYVEKDEEWKSLYSKTALSANTRNDKIYASSNEGSIIGYFYNKELFEKAGIKSPAETWDEFFEQCDKLLEANIIPLAMDTDDSAWVTSLWMGAFVATESKEGEEFMNQMMPMNYNTKEMIKAAEKVKIMLQKYTTKDAVGGKYENAANNFLSGQAAILANGPWMIGDFSDTSMAPEGFKEKVGTAVYPGNFVYDCPIQGFFATKQEDAALEEASIEMIRFFTSKHAQEVALEMQGMIPASSSVEITEEVKNKFPILAEFLDTAEKAAIRTNYLQATMYPNLLDVMSQELPNLAADVITPEEFCQKLTDAAAKNQ